MTEGEDLQVLIITQFFPPESMGGAHRWEKISEHLDESINPHILCTFPTFPFGEFERKWRPLETERINEIPVTRLFTYQPPEDSTLGRILNYGVFAFLSSLYVLLTFWRYDTIVTMSAPHTTFLPGLLAELTGRDWVIDIFDLWIDNAADLGYVDSDSIAFGIIKQLEYVSFRYADDVFVITDTMAEHYEKKYPELEFDAHVIPYGVDQEMFPSDIDSAKPTDIIYTGNLGTGQAFLPFFEAFARLDSETELMIVGDGERRGELEKVVEELGASDRVTFTGYVSRDEIPNVLSGAALSIVPLKTEYQLDYARPTKLLETMAVGTPYIASSVAEIENLSNEYSPGLAVENDPDQIHQAMTRLLSNPELRDEMGTNGIKLINDCHVWREIGKDVSRIVSW